MDDKADSGNWGIVELFGHQVVAGWLTKSEMLGAPMLRVDVPETKDRPAFTKLYGDKAVFSISFVSEQIARRAAEAYHVDPVSVYVPELVSVEQYRRDMQALKHENWKLRRGLPSGADAQPIEGQTARGDGSGLDWMPGEETDPQGPNGEEEYDIED